MHIRQWLRNWFYLWQIWHSGTKFYITGHHTHPSKSLYNIDGEGYFAPGLIRSGNQIICPLQVIGQFPTNWEKMGAKSIDIIHAADWPEAKWRRRLEFACGVR